MTSAAPLVPEYGPFFDAARQHRVIFYYVGYFSQNIVAAMAEAVKLQLDVIGADGPTRRKLFSCFVEMAQNIIHYSADALTPSTQQDHELRHGSVCISEHEGRYRLMCTNPVRADLAGDLRDRLETLRSMTMDEIKAAYRQALRSEAPEGSKGAGMGFLTMARDASEPLSFDFQPSQGRADTATFRLDAAV